MNHRFQETPRVLAIYPTKEGFGFAVLEGPRILIDWGVKTAGHNTTARRLSLVAKLLERYRPDLLAIEDLTAKCSRRGRRAKVLIERIVKLAAENDIAWRHISCRAVRQTFFHIGATTKDQIAKTIATQLPELAFSLPRPRKPWDSRAYSMSTFDATALALAYFSHEQDEHGV